MEVTDVVSACLAHLHALDLRRTACVCWAWCDLSARMDRRIALVTASGTNELALVDLRTGQLIQRLKAAPQRRHGGRGARHHGGSTALASSWPTGLALNDATNAVYISQYRVHGVLEMRRSRAGFRYQRTVVSNRAKFESPEGIAYHDGSIFLVSVEAATISRLSTDGKLLEQAHMPPGADWSVMWGMCARLRSSSSLSSLYVSAHWSDGGDYREPTPTNTGRLFAQDFLSSGDGFATTASGHPTYRPVDLPQGILNRPSNPAVCRHGCVHVSSFVNDPALPPFSRRIHKYRDLRPPRGSVHLGHLESTSGAELLCAPAGLAFTADGRLLVTSHREDQPCLVELSSCGCESLEADFEPGGRDDDEHSFAIACGAARVVVGAGVLDQVNYVLPIT